MFQFPRNAIILFFKATQLGLFEDIVPIKGHMRNGRFINPTMGKRRKAREKAPSGDLFAHLLADTHTEHKPAPEVKKPRKPRKPRKPTPEQLAKIQAKVNQMLAHAKVDAQHAPSGGQAHRKIYLAMLDAMKGIPEDVLEKAKQDIEAMFGAKVEKKGSDGKGSSEPPDRISEAELNQRGLRVRWNQNKLGLDSTAVPSRTEPTSNAHSSISRPNTILPPSAPEGNAEPTTVTEAQKLLEGMAEKGSLVMRAIQSATGGWMRVFGVKKGGVVYTKPSVFHPEGAMDMDSSWAPVTKNDVSAYIGYVKNNRKGPSFEAGKGLLFLAKNMDKIIASGQEAYAKKQAGVAAYEDSMKKRDEAKEISPSSLEVGDVFIDHIGERWRTVSTGGKTPEFVKEDGSSLSPVTFGKLKGTLEKKPEAAPAPAAKQIQNDAPAAEAPKPPVVATKPSAQTADTAEDSSDERTDHAPAIPVSLGSNDANSRHENTAEQPYQADGIKLSRGDLTQRPSADQLPGDLAQSLKPHARDAVNLALEQYSKGAKSFIIADGTGAGKTRQALATAEMLRRASPENPILIVTQNARIVADAFVRDAEAMGITVSPVDTRNEVKGGGIYVTTYSRVGRGDFDGEQFETIMFDEAHNLKNYTSKKTQSATTLLKAAKRSLLLTATPGDKPEHIGYLATAFGFSFIKAMSALGFEKGAYGFECRSGVSHAQSLQRLGSLFDDFTRKGLMVKREVSMDNLSVAVQSVRLNNESAASMAQAEQAMQRQVAKAEPKYRGLTKMLGLNRLRNALEPHKIDATFDAVKAQLDAGRKVVVFANRINDSDMPDWWPKGEESSTGTLDALADRMESAGIKVGKVYGKHLSKAKTTIAGFQSGNTQVVIATPQGGGTGINLDDTVGGAPRAMVVMTAPFSSLETVQMIGRINRLTTKSRANVQFIQAQDVPVDEWNFGIIRAKLANLGASVQGDIAALDLRKFGHLADEDLAAIGVHGVPVQDGPQINLADLGLKIGLPAGGGASATKTYLRVPYDDKDIAKKHGARWDGDRKQWYVTGDVPERLQKYLSGSAPTPATNTSTTSAPSKTYLRVPYDDKDIAKKHGARWDGGRKQWYVTGEIPKPLEKYATIASQKIMTPEQIAAVHAALQRIAGSCDGARREDGQGFNQGDARNGHALAACGELTQEQAQYGRELVWKYRRQFGDILAAKMGHPDGIPFAKSFRRPRRILFLKAG